MRHRRGGTKWCKNISDEFSLSMNTEGQFGTIGILKARLHVRIARRR